MIIWPLLLYMVASMGPGGRMLLEGLIQDGAVLAAHGGSLTLEQLKRISHEAKVRYGAKIVAFFNATLEAKSCFQPHGYKNAHLFGEMVLRVPLIYGKRYGFPIDQMIEVAEQEDVSIAVRVVWKKNKHENVHWLYYLKNKVEFMYAVLGLTRN